MQSIDEEPDFSDELVSGTPGDSAYEALHEVTPFGIETPPPEPTGVPAPPTGEMNHSETQQTRLARLHGGVLSFISLIARPTASLRGALTRYWPDRLRFTFRFHRRAAFLAARLSRLRPTRLPWKPRWPEQWPSLGPSRLDWPRLPQWRSHPVLAPAERAALRRQRRRRALVELAFWLGVAGGMVVLVVVALVCYYAMMLPDPREAGLTRKPPNITIRSADGEFLAERGMRRGYVPLDQTPRYMINAVIATEDRRFYYHFGFDLIGLSRAAYTNWKAGEVVQGGSTLTQQLAKNLFLQPRRHWTRKFEELILSLWLETKFTKDQIMELYLNRVYFGSGAYGIEAAAYHYFGKTTRDLSLPEAAMLTGLIKAPSSLSPAHNPDGAQERAGLVLKNMLDGQQITEKEYRYALEHPAQIRAKAQTPGFDYLVDWITELAPQLVGEAEGNFTVETTIDFSLQQYVDALLHQMMSQKGRDLSAGEAAVVLLSPEGAVKTLVGGLDYDANQFNRAVKGLRQPGSAFKPFIYLAALESGMTPGSQVEDAPVQLGDWRPQNYGGAYRGMIPLRTALAVSSNAAAVRLMRQVGRRKVIETAQRLGIYSDLDRGPTLALGTAEVTPLELTAAYAPFANGGYAVLPYVIERVRSENNSVLFERSHGRRERAVSAAHVSEMNDMLNAVVASGTGRKAALPLHQAAGKTGTTQRFNDAWFVGYTAHLVGGVWVGNDRNRHMRHVTGGTLPAEIWREMMVRAHRGLAPRPLPGARAPAPEDKSLAPAHALAAVHAPAAALAPASQEKTAPARNAEAKNGAEAKKSGELRKAAEAKKQAEARKAAEGAKRRQPRRPARPTQAKKPAETKRTSDGAVAGPSNPT